MKHDLDEVRALNTN